MYKVLALDLDGTVLKDDHTIHPEVKRRFKKPNKVVMSWLLQVDTTQLRDLTTTIGVRYANHLL